MIDLLLPYSSVSIVGMEKNTGKTECLNYLLRQLHQRKITTAVTSIGIDGETVDQVTRTHKPEITLWNDMLFITSEKHFREKKLTAEIINLSDRSTSLGRLVTARVRQAGKVILSGPTTTEWLKQLIDETASEGTDITLVDGALSRKSLGSPSITKGMILTTGTALSSNIAELVRKTKFVYHLINLPLFNSSQQSFLLQCNTGLWSLDNAQQWHSLAIPSSLLLDKYKDILFMFGNTLFVSGIITDKLLNFLRMQPNCSDILLIAKDFTKLFISRESLHAFYKRGGQLKVLLKTHLIAICVNPVSPAGYVIDSNKLQNAIRSELSVPVFDVMQ